MGTSKLSQQWDDKALVEDLLTRRSFLVKSGAAFVIAAVLLYVHVFFDPMQVGMEKSSRFTWERFRNIQKGETIDRVVAELGEPIREPARLEVINNAGDGRPDPCFPMRCRTYRFFGKSSRRTLVAGYREAIVIVGSDGRVVDTVEREE